MSHPARLSRSGETATRRREQGTEPLRRSSETISVGRGRFVAARRVPAAGMGNSRLAGVSRVRKRMGMDDGGRNDRRPVVWFEVEDFLRYFDHFPNPTGSQRVPFEIFVE